VDFFRRRENKIKGKEGSTSGTYMRTMLRYAAKLEGCVKKVWIYYFTQNSLIPLYLIFEGFRYFAYFKPARIIAGREL